MPAYALLLRASANRVYGAASFDLAAAELAHLTATVLRCELDHIERTTIGGVDYLLVGTVDDLDDRDLRILSNLSSLHALFQVDGDLLRPCEVTPVARADDDVVTIQRYSGKTNEAFTHLLVNLALASSRGAFDRLLAGEAVTLLDPACGRGTSLNRAIVYGLHASGIEVDQRDVEAYVQFILTWLKDKRFKHKLTQAKLRKGRDTPAHRVTVTYGRSKDPTTHRVVDVIHDDTLNARSHLKARSMDLLVCDLPYGVQHGAQPGDRTLQRGPAGLLADALPVWFDLLAPGGAMALSWNLRTMPRAELVALLETAGFEAPDTRESPFEHRVDRSIQRDVVVVTRSP